MKTNNDSKHLLTLFSCYYELCDETIRYKGERVPNTGVEVCVLSRMKCPLSIRGI